MANQTLNLTPELLAYLREHGLRESPVLAELRAATALLPEAVMQISPEQGQFMAFLLRLMGAKQVLEIGTFTGYSTLWLASALPEGGQVVTCDRNREWTDMARQYWERAGLAHRITLRLGDARETLQTLQEAGESDTYDFAFIDADKANYDAYYEACLTLVRPGSLIAIDNTLWGGAVIDPNATDPDTEAIRRLNRKLRDDQRVEVVMVPVGDGVTLVRRG
ncbi:MAG TPA: methyltransferase domain-containing protein [Gammaproteobacteria bacterium]|nr:methyltransferase domain-containing protein [Gammaproteobacteria bacterium]